MTDPTDAVMAALSRLLDLQTQHGQVEGAIEFLTGLTPDRVAVLGGVPESAHQPVVLCADGSWTETCKDQEHADRQRLFWDREVPQCAPHRVSWEPVNA